MHLRQANQTRRFSAIEASSAYSFTFRATENRILTAIDQSRLCEVEHFEHFQSVSFTFDEMSIPMRAMWRLPLSFCSSLQTP